VDVHRDAGPDKATTTMELAGVSCARLMLVVGSDNRLPHPNWAANKAFASLIAADLEGSYPGLCRGLRVQTGRYNQHVSPQAILVEVGATENTLDEALASMPALAASLASVLTADSPDY